MRRRAGLGRKRRPSLLFVGSVLKQCSGALARDDFGEAIAYNKSAIDVPTTLRASAATWLRDKKWMSEEEYQAFVAQEEARRGKP